MLRWGSLYRCTETKFSNQHEHSKIFEFWKIWKPLCNIYLNLSVWVFNNLLWVSMRLWILMIEYWIQYSSWLLSNWKILKVISSAVYQFFCWKEIKARFTYQVVKSQNCSRYQTLNLISSSYEVSLFFPAIEIDTIRRIIWKFGRNILQKLLVAGNILNDDEWRFEASKYNSIKIIYYFYSKFFQSSILVCTHHNRKIDIIMTNDFRHFFDSWWEIIRSRWIQDRTGCRMLWDDKVLSAAREYWDCCGKLAEISCSVSSFFSFSAFSRFSLIQSTRMMSHCFRRHLIVLAVD